MTEALFDALQISLKRDAMAFLPELLLCGAIVLMLVLRLVPALDKLHLGWLALIVSTCALVVSWFQWHAMVDHDAIFGDVFYDPRLLTNFNSLELFSGLIIYDNFTIFLRLFLYGFTSLTILLSLLTGIPDRDDSADFYTLLLGAAVGMSVMASANHLIMVYLGIEMTSLPSYALAGFLKGRRQSSEAALKYVVYGGGAAGVMLYGISLVAGKFGTGYLPDLTHFIAAGPLDVTLVLGMLFIFVGIAFKLAAFPFHFWCPDVFEGAAAEVAGYLSVASKGAALALLARIIFGLAGLTGGPIDPEAWARSTQYLVPIIAGFAIVTTTFGNLAAYRQNNLKRLLAYSTIAHAGFMMMGLATLNRDGAAAVLFYLIIYLIMNLGAFAVIAMLRNQTGSEDLRDFRGLVHRAPVLVITLAVFLLSLLGLPPLAGFTAKFQIFTAIFDAARNFGQAGNTTLSTTLYMLIVVGGLNSVLALFYYVKVLKVMILEKSIEEVEGRTPVAIPLPTFHTCYLSVLALALLALGVVWNDLSLESSKGVSGFHSVSHDGKIASTEHAKGDPH